MLSAGGIFNLVGTKEEKLGAFENTTCYEHTYNN